MARWRPRHEISQTRCFYIWCPYCATSSLQDSQKHRNQLSLRAQEAPLKAPRASSHSRDHSKVLCTRHLSSYLYGRHCTSQTRQYVPLLSPESGLVEALRSRFFATPDEFDEGKADHTIPSTKFNIHNWLATDAEQRRRCCTDSARQVSGQI